ncbi:hypothetical protein R1flu_020742 [Riccia fluitans]|uniref:Uncharacterized protein n=1 Tax=Riccia fluitans TaxID=41844 RepID=A0ABD1ZQT9_9MARC
MEYALPAGSMLSTREAAINSYLVYDVHAGLYDTTDGSKEPKSLLSVEAKPRQGILTSVKRYVENKNGRCGSHGLSQEVNATTPLSRAMEYAHPAGSVLSTEEAAINS